MSSMGAMAKSFLIAGFLTTGSINTLTKKWQFQTCSATTQTTFTAEQLNECPPGQKKFDKPWSQNILMFIGESFMLAVFAGKVARRVSSSPEGSPAREVKAKRPPFYIFALPASCDVLGTGIGGVGMLYISASVWQMMRGSLLIFTSFLSVAFLKKKLYGYNWLAVLTCAIGIILIGAAAMLDEAESGKKNGEHTGLMYTALGMGLTCFSQFFAASQMVVEEFFVKGYQATPEQVVGSEGVWGILIMIVLLGIFFAIPGPDAGSYENFADSAHMIANSGTIAGFICLYLGSISIFNFLGVTISGKLSAVTRTINDAMRTSIVWAIQLAVYYMGSENYGSPWTKHSWVQLIGFCLLVLGNLLNNSVVKVPGLYYPPAEGFPIAACSISSSQGGLPLVQPSDQH